MITITNRDLQEHTSFTHPQLKRWAVAFLEADKASGQHSGIPRRYNFEQAFRIHMGGHLVRNLKFSLIEARQILDDVTGWMKKRGWRISECVSFKESKLSGGYVAHHNFPWRELKIDIWLGINDRFIYRSKIMKERKKIKEPNRWREIYDLENFGDESIGSRGPIRSIDFTPTIQWLVSVFINKGSE